MQWKVLAGLRFFLSLIVVSHHLKDFVPNYGKDLLCTLGKLNGLSAVLGFLIVSGYSIAHSISKNPNGFYKRRILRIYPLYFCGVLLSLTPFLVVGSKFTIHKDTFELIQPDLHTIVGNLLFLQTFVVDTIQSNNPLWTLAVEVLCYILAPIFIKLSNKILIYLLGFSAMFYGLYPYIYRLLFPQTSIPIYSAWKFGIPFCFFLWAWLTGFLYFRINKKGGFKIILFVLTSMLLVLNHHYIGKLGIFTYIVSFLVLIFSCNIKLPKSLLNAFDYLGDISYPLYLFHMPTFIFVYSVLGINSSWIMALFSLLVSMLFYHVVDLPMRSKFRDVQPAKVKVNL